MAKIKKYFPAMRVNISVPHLNEFGNKIVTNITADNGIEVSKVDNNESFKKEIRTLKQAGVIKIREVEIADKAPKATPKFGNVKSINKIGENKKVESDITKDNVNKKVESNINKDNENNHEITHTPGLIKGKPGPKPKVENKK